MSYKVAYKLGYNSDGYTISGLINTLKGNNAPDRLSFRQTIEPCTGLIVTLPKKLVISN